MIKGKAGRIIIETTTGKIEGSTENGLFSFKGIPYAAPPVGDLRWRPPQPCQPWKGIRKAQTFGASPPQPDTGIKEIAEFCVDGPRSEDCLFLNIWTPGTDGAARPVMVWVHGGIFTMGSGSQASFSGHILASRGNIVVVTLNYRLGVLGFLNLNEVTGGKIPATGNEGLLDQIAALEWIRNNIAAFGGNPQNITLFGESAGGMCIQCLMAMPQAEGLFHKAVLQSSIGPAVRTLDQAEKISARFLQLAGTEDAAVLSRMPVHQVLAAQLKLNRASGGKPPTQPVLDGKIICQPPLEAVKNGASPHIPLLGGTNAQEWKLFSATNPEMAKMDSASLNTRLQRLFPAEQVSGLIDKYRQVLLRQGEPAAAVDIFSAVRTAMVFREPLDRYLEARCLHEKDVYSYLFTWKSAAFGGVLGACHGLEIGFVFGTFEAGFGGSGPEAAKLSLKMQDAWAAFARSGDPSCESTGYWPRYGEKKETLRLGD